MWPSSPRIEAASAGSGNSASILRSKLACSNSMEARLLEQHERDVERHQPEAADEGGERRRETADPDVEVDLPDQLADPRRVRQAQEIGETRQERHEVGFVG